MNRKMTTLVEVLDNCNTELSVYNNVFDNEYPTWCNNRLTPYGKEVYKDILQLPVILCEQKGYMEIQIPDNCDEEDVDSKLSRLFLDMAGYILASEYDKRFIEED